MFIFITSDEKEAGSAEEQPARDNLTDWNGQEREIFPTFKNKLISKELLINFSSHKNKL